MSTFARIGLILAFFFSSLRFCFIPTVVIDAAAPGDEVSARASGHLYGLAEAGVPDDLMVDSLDIASVSQKSPDGLQHPTGDLDHVAAALGKAAFLVTYLQDDYSTWYYENAAVNEARRAGTWDWRAFLREDYLPRVEKTVRLLAEKDYAERVVCCLYNECDNGVWFGETRTGDDGNVWGDFSEAGRDAFFAAWKETFALVRKTAPSLKIGGPGYYEYNAGKERDFLTFCKENACLPDVMIYHELGEFSARDLAEHAAEYRALEQELGIAPLPVIVTEYGTMAECGNPGEMLKYVVNIENAGVYGNIAFWRLADNLNDNAADGNMPNACWWLYRWYADLEGRLLSQKKVDLLHGDFAKAVKAQREMKHKDFYALSALNGAGDGITVLCGACEHTGQLRFRNLRQTNLGKRVRVRIEEAQYRGLTGAVARPAVVKDYETAAGNALTVKLKDMREGAVYRVTLAPAGAAPEPAEARADRYEAEDGRLLGNAYTYRSAYAATGGTEERPGNLVGGMEQPGDGVELTVRVPETGDYDLDVIYGKHNDGDGPAGRVTGTALLTVVNRPLAGARSFSLALPNTIKSEYTSCLRQRVRLTAGKNRIRFEHVDGTFVLDSILLTRADPQADAAAQTPFLLPETEKSGNGKTAFIAVAPTDGYYPVYCDTPSLTVDGGNAGAVAGGADVYLRRGLNLLTLDGEAAACACGALRSGGTPTILPADMTLTAPARVSAGGILTGIGSTGGEASFSYAAGSAGDYRVTLCYANNEEGGYHDYNVDLIEEYFTVTVNGEAREVMCRNTYSEETFSTVTFSVALPAGESKFSLSNDGAIRFDGRETRAPALRWISVNPITEKEPIS